MSEGQQQQRYRVIERLASGGMAEVFIAESAGIEGFKKRVAIKRVLPHLSEKKAFIAMFLDEARLSAHLSHSCVAQVFDIGVGDNAYFIVMEYVDGADLKGVIEYLKKTGKPFPMEPAVFIASKLCEGLSYAHELTNTEGEALHVVHRDMSPPNVLITKYGEVKIVDFGLAKATSQLQKSESGIIKGKFSYLSPEAALGQEVDGRTDVFAVGIILWEMLAGRRLFFGDTDFATVKQVQKAEIPSISQINKDVPLPLERIIARSLARDPKERYQTARDLGRDLISFLYKNGKAVSPYDIAELVRGAMSLRKKTATTDRALAIDKLIEEALLEFTSLQKGDQPAPQPTKQAAPSTGFEDLSSWTDELMAGTQGSVVSSSAQLEAGNLADLEEGNLAALEEDDAPVSQVKTVEATPSPTPANTTSSAPKKVSSAPSQESQTTALVNDESVVKPANTGGATKAILAVVALVILAAGAYFGGVFK
ncbi:MAG: protein kinase [Polyangiaceae bacterium]|nr:protein kinase [Polyangiaceae bacterium]